MSGLIGLLRVLWVSLVSLLVLSLREGVMAFCPETCICNDSSLMVECVGSNLETVPMTLNPEIRSLILKYNNFKEVGSASFQFHPELEQVDISHNQLFGIQDKTFDAQKKLLTLRINDNKLSRLNDQTFFGLDSLVLLNLRSNEIKLLPAGVFEHLPNLKELYLGDNGLKSINVNAFSGLASLQTLRIDHNHLARIPQEPLSLLAHSSVLDISFNGIQGLADNSFSFLPNLKELDVSGNQLSLNVSRFAFQGLEELTSLRLNKANLSSVPTEELFPLARLQQLYLNENNFVSIAANSFAGLRMLKEIEIGGCIELTLVQAGAFNGTNELTRINISNNALLDQIEDNAFPVMPNLRFVDFSNNSLSTVSYGLFGWRDLEVLHVGGNPWQCDCYIQFLQSIISELKTHSQVTLNKTGECSGPRSEAGLSIIDADLSHCVNKLFINGPKPARTQESATLIVIISVVTTIALTALGILIFHFRGKVQVVFKEMRWQKTEAAIRSKEMRYGQEPFIQPQKSFIQHEEYFISLAKHQAEQAASANIPVTEL